MDAPNLTAVERHILANQFKIMAWLEIDGDRAGYTTLATVVEEGYEVEYQNLFESFLNPVSEEECTYVRDVMDMYGQLQAGLQSASDRKGIEDHDVNFPGFDGNNACRRMSYANFLVSERNWDGLRLSSGDMNSHGGGDAGYPSMLERFNTLARKYELSIADIKLVLDK